MAISAQSLNFMRIEASKPSRPSKSRVQSKHRSSGTWRTPSTRDMLQQAGTNFGHTSALHPYASLNVDDVDESLDDETEKQFFEVQEDAGMHERWLAVLDGRNAAECPKEELRLLVDAGTPLRHRHVLWPRWWVRPDQPTMDDAHGIVEEDTANQIELDLKRTFGRSLKAGQRDSLRNVLRSYASYNPQVGYCQGMSFIAAVPLLLEFSEAEALAGLRFIVEEVCPGYHGPRLEGFFRDIAVLESMVNFILPDVHQEMESLDIPLHMLATDHLLTLSARTWPLHPVVRLWDVILIEGSPALLASFLALLQLYFLDAVAASRAAHRQPDEIPTDAACRFREMARIRAARDLDELMVYTRKFIPMVRGPPTEESGDCALLTLLRSQADRDAVSQTDPDRPTSAGSATASLSSETDCRIDQRECTTEPPSTSEHGAAVASSHVNMAMHSHGDSAIDSVQVSGTEFTQQAANSPAPLLLIKALLTINVGNVQTLRVGAVDRCKTVVQMFIKQHSLDKCFADALTAWLKKAEAGAERYPITVHGDVREIYREYLRTT